ncbi:MAG: FAD-dependent oxidoreductase [Myxococcales bacterium]|nr:MAG: FAD-dependent oxidoreductase [Myxococcales bacterium]
MKKLRKVSLSSTQALSATVDLFSFLDSQPESFEYRAGQWIAPVLADKASAFSLATAPGEKDRGAFDIAVKKGPAQDLLRQMPRASTLEVLGPEGDFIYEDEIGPVLFVGTGTGVAALRSMIMYRYSDTGCGGQSVLLVGHRRQDDMLWASDFLALESKHGGFQYCPTLSSEAKSWNGLEGRIQKHLPKMLEARRWSKIYICGHLIWLMS